MKTISKIVIIISICLLSTSVFASAEGSILSLKVNKENIALEDKVLVDILGENLENIAGANIKINYDGKKIKLMTKQILIKEENIINIQRKNQELKNLEKLQDANGTSKIIFGLKKNKTLINDKERTLATLTFKAIDIGDARLTLGIASQLIKEKNSNGDLDYVYTNPKIQEKDINIHITSKGKIRGNILTSDGFNIDNAKIKILKDSDELQAITLENNTYIFENIENGRYTIIVEKLGYETFKRDITLEEGRDFVLDFELQRIKEDVDRNGSLELEDLVFVASRFGVKKDDAKWSDDADINKDHVIDMRDILFISRTLE